MLQKVTRAAALFASAALLAGCGVSSPSSNRTLDFTMTLDPVTAEGLLDTDVVNFTITKNGEYEIRVTEYTAGPNVPLGISLGTQAPNSGCLVLRETVTVAGPLALSGAMPSGQYCIAVFDLSPGLISATQTVKVRASVP